MSITIGRLVIGLSLLLGVIMPGFAQDDVQTIPQDLSGFYIITFANGTLELDNNTGSMTLSNIPGLLPWVLDTPVTYAGRIDTLLFLLGWGGSPSAPIATAVLETDSAIYELAISPPEFDILTSSLVAGIVVEDAFSLTNDAVIYAPTIDFTDGTLFIEFTAEFEAAMVEGSSNVTDDFRMIPSGTTNVPRPPTGDE